MLFSSATSNRIGIYKPHQTKFIKKMKSFLRILSTSKTILNFQYLQSYARACSFHFFFYPKCTQRKLENVRTLDYMISRKVLFLIYILYALRRFSHTPLQNISISTDLYSFLLIFYFPLDCVTQPTNVTINACKRLSKWCFIKFLFFQFLSPSSVHNMANNIENVSFLWK